ncbi:MAG: hypothetical protein WBH36_03985, partial [Syntrophobacteria bacterium]
SCAQLGEEVNGQDARGPREEGRGEWGTRGRGVWEWAGKMPGVPGRGGLRMLLRFTCRPSITVFLI